MSKPNQPQQRFKYRKDNGRADARRAADEKAANPTRTLESEFTANDLDTLRMTLRMRLRAMGEGNSFYTSLVEPAMTEFERLLKEQRTFPATFGELQTVITQRSAAVAGSRAARAILGTELFGADENFGRNVGETIRATVAKFISERVKDVTVPPRG